LREKLAPLLGQRRRFIGWMERIGSNKQGRLMLCLRSVSEERTGELVADHIWVPFDAIMVRAEMPRYLDKLSFSAEVGEYKKSGGIPDFELTRISEVCNRTAKNRRKRQRRKK
jgi:hypothetical protein